MFDAIAAKYFEIRTAPVSKTFSQKLKNKKKLINFELWK